MNRRLTLDYGVRFYWNQPYYEESGLVSGFFPALYNPAKAVRLVQPAIVNGRRVGVNPVDGSVLPSAGHRRDRSGLGRFHERNRGGGERTKISPRAAEQSGG